LLDIVMKTLLCVVMRKKLSYGLILITCQSNKDNKDGQRKTEDRSQRLGT
jgi:hypothetical protein